MRSNNTNNKEDLREYGDQELDLRVQNDEYLYKIYTRAVNQEKFSLINDEIDELFIYTDDQLRELAKSFYEEIEETNRILEEEVDEEEEEEIQHKEDLTGFDNQELDIRIQRDEKLFYIFRDGVQTKDFTKIKAKINECFFYTVDQLSELQRYFRDEIEDYKELEAGEEEEDKANPPEDPAPSLVYPRDYNIPENQEIKRKFVEQKVFACVTPLVEWIIGQSVGNSYKDIPFTYDDLENLSVQTCPYCGSDNIRDPKEDEDGFVCLECEQEFEDYDLKEKEVFEWWIVSELLYRELQDAGEVVLSDGLNYYWGRCTTGQVIFLDEGISRICHNMEILKGQKYEWQGKE